MDFEPVKKFFSLLVTAFGLFIFIAIIYSTFLIAHYAQKKQTIENAKADEMISIFPSLKLER